jgi:hypothetical protein
MKTSNKILVGFLAVVFLIPLMMIMSFKRKIAKGQFTVQLQDQQGSSFRNGHFAAYKVVKIVSPGDGLLKVMLKESDSLYYDYHKMGDDSIRISNIGDTLLIKYDARKTGSVGDMSRLHLNLKLPFVSQLVIENADITVDSVDIKTPHSITASISNKGRLQIGTFTREFKYEDRTEEVNFPVSLQTLTVNMIGGELILGSKTNLQQLKLNAEGASILTIKDGASVQETTGSLSGESSVNANWRYVKSLATMATE